MSLEFMIKEIKSFEETKDLKYEYHDITTIYQYIRLKKRFDPNDPNELYEPVLKEDPIRIEYVPSKSHEKQIKIQDKARNIDTTYHSDYLLDAQLKDFELITGERGEAITKAKIFIEAFEKKRFMKGLYIYGPNRTGKTFLLSAIVNELSKKDVKTVFTYVPDLIRNVHASIDEGGLEEKVRQLKNCDLLVLDDLGSATMSRWFRDQIFGPVLQYRLSVGLPVLISSNLEIQNLVVHLTDEKVTGDRMNAIRITTRINELTEPVKLSEKRY